jgi:Sap-like sulfolipid-1-addressing protein
MSLELVLLGVLNALRPTSLAIVYALLSAAQPRRLMVAFICAGVAFSLATGIGIVLVIHGAELRHGTSTFDGLVNLIGGVAALGFAAGLAQGRTPRRPSERRSSSPSRIMRALRQPSAAVAAGAGIATHLPGLLYLVALNQISAPDPSAGSGIAQVLGFNAIWWSIPVASLAFFLLRPDRTRDAIAAVNSWVRNHDRQIVIALFFVAGIYLTVKGAIDLAG